MQHVLDALDEHMVLNVLAPSVTSVASVTIAPPAAARRVAARALAVRKTLPPSRRGGLTTTQAHAAGIGSGVQRAVDIAAGRKVDAMRVHRFFQRFRGTVAKARAQGKTVHDSKAIMAWDLWGGDPMRVAVQRAVARVGR